MTSVLVTGGAGYIGSHACKLMAAAGLKPVCYDNLSYGHEGSVRWGPLIIGDVADTDLLVATIEAYRPAAVVHFAAFAYVGESVTDPAKYYRNNVSGTLSLLDAMRRTGIDKIVFSSSCATYGIPDMLPIREDTQQRPINPYGRSKLMVEHILADYAAAYGIHYASLRYFNACGADPEGEIGERHDPETHLIPRALMAAAGAIPHLEVFGEGYDTRDGTCVRDYIHVSDLGAAHVLALDYLAHGGESIALNLGTGEGISIREILGAIERITGRKVPIIIRPGRPGDPPELWADASAARAKLSFVPKYSDVETIIRTAWPSFGS
jgi:UDP-arabinose 4-epimerase